VVPVSEYTVGEVARLAHVSVRTLHHYDDIGLLTPSGRSAAGYRLYSPADLRRLQHRALRQDRARLLPLRPRRDHRQRRPRPVPQLTPCSRHRGFLSYI
jgi:DNA-binding transcriptional MerR regulator